MKGQEVKSNNMKSGYIRVPYSERTLEELYEVYSKKAKNAQFKADRIKTEINNKALEEIMRKNKWTITDVITKLSEFN